MDFNAIAENDRRERDRALAVIAKAQRDNLNVVETMVNHFISKTLIEELTGTEVVFEKQGRRDISEELSEWAEQNEDAEVTVAELQELLEISNSVALKIVKNPDYFLKIRRGVYSVRNGKAKREAAKLDKGF